MCCNTDPVEKKMKIQEELSRQPIFLATAPGERGLRSRSLLFVWTCAWLFVSAAGSRVPLRMCSPGELPISVRWKITEGPLEWTTRTPSWAALTWLWTCSGRVQTPSSHSPRRVLCSSSQTAPGEKTGGRLGGLRTELLQAFPPFRTQKINLTGCPGCRIPSSGHPL